MDEKVCTGWMRRCGGGSEGVGVDEKASVDKSLQPCLNTTSHTPHTSHTD